MALPSPSFFTHTHTTHLTIRLPSSTAPNHNPLLSLQHSCLPISLGGEHIHGAWREAVLLLGCRAPELPKTK